MNSDYNLAMHGGAIFRASLSVFDRIVHVHYDDVPLLAVQSSALVLANYCQ